MSSRGMTMIAVFALAVAVSCSHAEGPVESPQQLIKDVVYNELTDHQHHGYFEYLDVKRTGQGTVLKAEVETNTGRVHRMLAEDGKPLTAEQQGEESRRLEALLDYQPATEALARLPGRRGSDRADRQSDA